MEIIGGAILGEETLNKDDLIFGANIYMELWEEIGVNNRQWEHEYNQWQQEKTWYCCTVYSAFNMLGYLKNTSFTYEQMGEVIDKMVSDGKLNLKAGGRLADAIDYVRRWWNERNPNNQVISYQVNLLDDSIMNIIKKEALGVQIGYYLDPELYNETETLGYTTKTKYNKWGGHAVCLWGEWVIDNYKWKRKKNRYNFENFKQLIQNGTIFKAGYVFLNK